MKVLVVGASGATGRRLVLELLNREVNVTIIVRNKALLPEAIKNNKSVHLHEASILNIREDELSGLLHGCDAVASCLGHRISMRGIFGDPKMLVTDAVKRLCTTIISCKADKPVKFILMNTTANLNNELHEQRTSGEKIVFSILRNLLPPQLDNEHAAAYLQSVVGKDNKKISWSIVRPDTLIDEETVSPYQIVASPTRSPVFDAGKTSRVNVAHFMVDLIMKEAIWDAWKLQMPVIYNTSEYTKKSRSTY